MAYSKNGPSLPAHVGRLVRKHSEKAVADLNKLKGLGQRRRLRRRVFLLLPLRLDRHEREPHTGKALATQGYRRTNVSRRNEVWRRRNCRQKALHGIETAPRCGSWVLGMSRCGAVRCGVVPCGLTARPRSHIFLRCG